jgi:imidazolonepropionase-like amidohydrolase
VTEETTAFANARIFDSVSAELREGCVRVAAGTIAEVAEGPGPGDRIVDCRSHTIVPGHGDPRPPELGCCLGGGHMAEVVDGVDALRRAARERLRSGAHAIKIMASGGVISPSDPLRVPQYSPEEIRVVAEEATRRGSYVAAHAYSAAAIGVAVANGVRSIEHGNLLDAPTAAMMAERDAFLVPTLVTYDAMERRGAELGLAPVARAGMTSRTSAGRQMGPRRRRKPSGAGPGSSIRGRWPRAARERRCSGGRISWCGRMSWSMRICRLRRTGSRGRTRSATRSWTPS